MSGDYFVYPGQLLAGGAPCSIRTILGSCVAVVLSDRKSGVIGICHYLLVSPKGVEKPNFRYGVAAIPGLIKEMQSLGAGITTMEAHIYGGANINEQLGLFHEDIGATNIAVAKKILAEFGIRIVREDTGGTNGRNIRITTEDHIVRLKQIAEDSSEGGLSKTGSPRPVQAKSASVLIVDDSQTARAVIERALSRHPEIKIAGTAADAFEARDKIVSLRPDVLLLDIEMPRLNGVEFLEKLMAHHPMPVIMVSSLRADGGAARRALELGAIEFVQKPSQYDPAVLRDLSDTLPPKILAAASVKDQLQRIAKIAIQRGSPAPHAQSALVTDSLTKINRGHASAAIDLICVTGNVGCMNSLEALLAGLEDDSPPVALAISTISTIPQAFLNALKGRTKLNVMQIVGPTTLARGKIYFCDADHHIIVEAGPRGSLLGRPTPGIPVQGQRPSGDVLMLSAAKVRPSGTCGILLGGFGKDGLRGLSAILDGGGMTLVEDPEEAGFPHNINSALDQGVGESTVSATTMPSVIFDRRSKTGG